MPFAAAITTGLGWLWLRYPHKSRTKVAPSTLCPRRSEMRPTSGLPIRTESSRFLSEPTFDLSPTKGCRNPAPRCLRFVCLLGLLRSHSQLTNLPALPYTRPIRFTALLLGRRQTRMRRITLLTPFGWGANSASGLQSTIASVLSQTLEG